MSACGDGDRASPPAARKDDGAPSAAAEATAAYDDGFRAAYLAGLEEGAGVPAGTRADVAAPAEPDAHGETRFRRSDKLARETSARFLERYRPLETLTGSGLQSLVSGGDALAAFHDEMAKSGLDPDDVADVFALHDLVHWAIANREPVPERRLLGIREAILPRVRREVARAGDSDGDRQRLADRAAILAVIRGNEYAQLVKSGNESAVRRYSDAVRGDFLTRSGIDLRRRGPVETTLAATGTVAQ